MPNRSHSEVPGKRPSRLFVIDDEPTIRAAIKRFLTRRGWEVEEAEDGREAQRLLLESEPGRYDVIMCDLRMPHFTGSDLYAVLLQKRPDLVKLLVFSTGDVASNEASTFLEGSERPVIEKPFELQALEQVLDRVRDDGRGSAAS
ncbi:MAG TPA: response regulator [Gemmatimonadaceae bacterium]|jgi:CheY-like chemotaxis protein